MRKQPPKITPPLCDKHGYMQAVPWYITMEPPTIGGYIWMCNADGCDSYGGPAPKPKQTDQRKGDYHVQTRTTAA